MSVSKNVLVVAPYALYRQGVKIALSQGKPSLQYNTVEADTLTAKHMLSSWDLIILSDHLLIESRLRTIRLLISAADVPVLVISEYIEPDALYKSHRIGAQGLVFSQAGLTELYRVANKLLSGRRHWPNVPADSNSQGRAGVKSSTRISPRLTERQEQVLEYLKVGLSNKQISYHMNLSESTVKSHMSVLLRKYDVPTRTKLISKL